MEIQDTGCCAVEEIVDLSEHSTAQEAMLEFCYHSSDMDYNSGRRSLFSLISGFYIFTGVIKHTDGSKTLGGFTYGPNLAAFIKKNGLGRVTASVSAPNRRNLPNHIVRVWTWAPNQGALERWYRKHGKGSN